MESGFSIGDLIQEAQARWLKPVEVLFILQNHPNVQLTQEPVQKPASGSLYLFNKRVLRFFRRDGHSWRKKKDGRTVGEAHERLKVGNAETLNCYYAHGEHNPNFQRRSYWMLDPAYEHIVLVHYREITEGRHSSLTSPGSSFTLSQGRGSQPSPNPDSTPATSDLDSYQTFSSPGSGEVSSDVVTRNDVFDHLDKINGTGDFYSPPRPEVSQALRRLEEQLSLDDDSLTEFGAVGYQNEKNLNDFDLSEHEGVVTEEVDCPREGIFFSLGFDGTDVGMRDDSNSMHILNADDNNGVQSRRSLGGDKFTFEGQSLYWKEMLDSGKISSDAGCHNELANMSKINVLSYLKPEKPSSWRESSNDQENSLMLDFDRNRAQNVSTLLLPEDVNMKVCQYSSAAYETECSNQTFGSNVLSEIPFAEISNLTIAQGQKFTIREISPGWGYASDITKVIIVGSFLCEPSESVWSCLLGDTEVPLQTIQDGVLCFQAPPRVPGKVTLCITSGYREACSEIREFEYRSKPTDCDHCNSPPMGASMSPEELLLLVRFAKMLLLDPLSLRSDDVESGIRFLRNYKADDDSWSHVIETLLIGSGTFSSTMNWLLQELLKDKLEQWLSYRSARMLSKNEQGIIHMVTGLGFEWALKSILCHGVNINFRDINGWTALHWAARFGREKMVAALIATGASAGAVTDPNSQDPSGKTAASIAASSGHKGLAGYLSEVALTSHLSSLTLEESELSKGAADVEAEITVNSVSNEGLTASEDQLSLKNTLAAVRNSALAAARIQSAFRAHSFRKRQLNEAASATVDEYGFTRTDIHGISAASKRDHDDAALSIQKKYRGWKGRRDFLDFRQKVVMIQAHVRGHQVRNKMICWAVGILEKVVLRWRRRGAGLRGYRVEAEAMKESEDEDILKVFRKERVEVAIDQAVSRVLSMVDSPEARQQYHRVLGRFHQARAELGSASRNADVTDMEHAISQFL